MKIKMPACAVSVMTLILLSCSNPPLRAQSALEQLIPLSLGAQLAVPLPSAAMAAAGLPEEEARKKLPLFDYLKTDVLSIKTTTLAVHKEYTIETIELLINDPLRQLGEFRQKYLFYRAKRSGPRPTVLVFPPFSGTTFIDDWGSAHFIKKGYNTVVIVPSESVTDETRPLEKGDDLFIRNIIAGRMCIDLLETFPEVDKEKVFAYDISMGGISATLAFGVEPRIKKAAEIVGGGDIPGIMADTDYYKLKNVRDARMKIEGIANLSDFRARLKEIAAVDPLDFGSLRNPEDIIMVMGHGDTFVPDIYQKKLYDAFSRPLEGRFPALIRSNFGHVITTLEFKQHIDRFAEFFAL